MLRVTDSRTGRSYELPIVDGAIRAIDLRQIKISGDDFGLLSYDPAFQNTASCRSAITFIDGDKGILRYRGYPIEELASRASFLEVAYLMVSGELPDGRAAGWAAPHHRPHVRARERQEVHRRLPRRRSSDGHAGEHHRGAVDLLSGGQARRRHREPTAADASADRQAADARCLRLSAHQGAALRLPGQRPELHRQLPPHAVQDGRAGYQPNPVLERALDVLFILHADHEQNCSTNACAASAARGSTRTRPSRAAGRRSTDRCTAAPTRP